MSKRIVILGAGESGVGAAVLATVVNQYTHVFVSDYGIIKPQYKQILNDFAIQWEEGQHSLDIIYAANIVVKSPGIREDLPIITQLREQGVPIISEIEFASQFTQAKHICITGSNGKTTTTLLTHHLLKNAGFNVGLAGNVGQGFAFKVAEDILKRTIVGNDDFDTRRPYDYYIIELSSFQLDGMFTFKPHISILTNITPDHLDRYNHDMQLYIDSKFRVTQNLSKSDYFIYGADDPIVTSEIEKRSFDTHLLPFSINGNYDEGAFVEGSNIRSAIVHVKTNDTDFTIRTDELALKGRHNLYNSMAAALAARLLGVSDDSLHQSLMTFASVEHRLEPVVVYKDREFINDSKATNIDSTWYALDSMTNQVIWIVGGIDKGNDYNTLMDLVKEKVRAIVCLGKDNSKIHKVFDSIKPLTDANSMAMALTAAYKLSQAGDTILLSPACASFDLFQNYEDRGRQFKQVATNIEKLLDTINN